MFRKPNLAWNEYARLDIDGYTAEPEPALQKTVQMLEDARLPKIAIDLGAGKGRDTRFLLEKGFQVIAVENDAESIKSLTQLEIDQLQILECSLANIDTEALPEQLSLVNASYSLPYVGSNGVKKVLRELSDKLILGGRFCGQLFGPRCSFVTANPTEVASHTKDEIVELFSTCNLAVESCDPEQGIGKRMDKEPYEKDFHHVLARKVK